MLTLGAQTIPSKKRVRLTVLLIISLLLIPAAHSNTEATSDTTKSVDLATQLAKTNSFLSVKEGSGKPLIYAKSGLLIDADTGDELWSKNADQIVPVASTTKITTALTTRRLLKLDEVVTITPSAVSVPGSKIKLAVGEQITVENLLKGLLIQSGNDAAFALAEHFGQKRGGDYKLFVEEMNNLVRENNIKSTTYNDPAGLDDEIGRSTARDLAHTARLLLRDPFLSEIVRTPNTTISSVDGRYKHELKNSNRLILSDTPYFMPKAIGIKTGFTPSAGHSLVAGYKNETGTLIGVILNTDSYTISASAAEMKKLFQWAEENIVRIYY